MKIIAIIASSNLPSKANLIEVNPIQTPIKVNMFGKITLALFLSLTILKFFFCGSIYFFASNVSPAIAVCPILTKGS